jgi:tripartite-type tricarboxylate transporter receptor subunit TctC
LKKYALVLAAGLIALTPFATAQSNVADYPNKPIRFMAGFPPGGVADIVARIVANAMSQRLGQPILVDNKAGAGGVIGADAVAKSAPDGYTIGIGTSGSLAVNVTWMPNLPYSPLKDFELVSKIVDNPMALVINPSLNVNTLQELITLAKSKPKQFTYGSAGGGTSMHLAGELFKQMAGVDIAHSPYKGSSPAVVDLIAGHIQMGIIDLATVKPFLEAGRLKALAVTSSKRSAIAPELPTMAEAGVPGYELSSWVGLIMAAGTPPQIVNRINKELVASLSDPAVRQQLLNAKTEPVPGSSAEMRAAVVGDIEKFAKLIKSANLKPH